ncbi:hypothetical protein TrRE_jg12295 [Triparma retinervis]|uniref:PH domain-containing protein n=1 Tax=Triparma retinervis TaxID=2557542 RepID=A0A9W6ZB52_9STRA|nr:hypothetical protein TrRE_jg12295 [Triparma retinervis]
MVAGGEDMNRIRPFVDDSDPQFLLQGTLEKESVSPVPSPLSLLGPSYKRRFFRLTSSEVIYYTAVSRCSWGYVPIDERGRFPWRLVTEVVEDVGGGRENEFELWVTNAENSRYPGRNHKRRDEGYARVYKLRAMDGEVKEAWLDVIRRYKTNLGRLLAAGDDWDEEEIMSTSSMLSMKAAELREACLPSAKYSVKPGRKLPKGIVQGGRERNEMNSMNDRRHMTVYTKPGKGANESKDEGGGQIPDQPKNCGCSVS